MKRGGIMKIAIVTESSTVDKNKDVAEALKGFGHEVINIGMKKAEGEPTVTYIETSLIAAILLDLKVVDLVVGGCGTGQGFFNAVLQYPGISCGLIQDPADAWLFAQINGGNCISLALNKGYGWAGDVNLKFIFEKLFSVEFGSGYPEHRKDIQKKARLALSDLSRKTHLSFDSIIEVMDSEVLKRALTFPDVRELIQTADDSELKKALEKKYAEFTK
jgi:ribose 5-phosphate isomerase RpiB